MRISKLLRKTAILTGLMLSVTVVGTGCKNKDDNGSSETGTQPTITEAVKEEVTQTPEATVEPEKKEATLTDGIFEYTISNDGKTYLNYINFYDNGVFYYSKYNNGQYNAGYYTVVEGPFEIHSTGPVSGATYDETIKCDSQIILYDVDGKTEIGQCGYIKNGNIIGLTLQDSHDFTANPTSTHTSEEETGVNMAEYYIEGDEYSMVAIKHNGTYQDTISMMIAGSWTKEGNLYTLVNDATQKSYTLTDNENGTATYVAEDGTETNLVAPVELSVKLVLSGTTTGAYGDLAGVITCYDDASLTLAINYAGSDKNYEGTWELAKDYSKVTLIIDGNTYEAPRAEDNTFKFEYPCSDGTKDVVIPFASVAK